jgi:H+/Cl- antiporter ClcA
MTGNGTPPPKGADKNLGEIVSEVTEKASLLVRQEIDLAKAEVTDKAKKLATGAGVGAAAGVFLVFALAILLNALSWFFADLYGGDVAEEIWFGFLTTFAILVVLAVIAGLVASRLFKKGAPPTPDLAIEEAKRTRAELEAQAIGRDQVGRTLEKGEELKT